MINQVVDRMIRNSLPDIARINRSLKLYHYAKSIAEAEGCDGEAFIALCLSAILFDLGERESADARPSLAASMLSDLGFPESAVERAVYLVENGRDVEKVDSLDFQILVESEYLVKLKDEAPTAVSMHAIKNKIFKTETGKRFCSLLNA